MQMKTQRRISRVKSKLAKLVLGVTAVANGVMTPTLMTNASAGDVASSVTEPMNQVISVVLSVLAVVGVFMLVKSVAELVNSIQEQDNSGIFRASRGIAAGALMISIRMIIGLFGYDL